MKKLICAILMCFTVFCAYAGDNKVIPVNRAPAIPGAALNYYLGCLQGTRENCPSVINNSAGLTKEQIDIMYEKTWDFAGSVSSDEIELQDFFDVCAAAKITTWDCYDKVFAPFLNYIQHITFPNVCLSNLHGNSYHCVDNVFTTRYIRPTGGTMNKPTDFVPYETESETAQDVVVNPSTAFGFAYEYALYHYNDKVVCLSSIKDNWINCSTYDNLHKYTFKFAGIDTENPDFYADGKGHARNIVRGFCAMMWEPYFEDNSSLGQFGCRTNCDKKTLDIADKFALSTYEPLINVFNKSFWKENSLEMCPLRIEQITVDNIHEYPGYEYMTYAFSKFQVNYTQDLLDKMKVYIELQLGKKVNSFDCKYSPQKFSWYSKYYGAENTIGGEKEAAEAFEKDAMDPDDVLSCKIDGVPVDFVFDDLYESYQSYREASDDAMHCLYITRASDIRGKGRGSAVFDGKYCNSINQDTCDKLGDIAEWDDGLKLCKMKKAAWLSNRDRALEAAARIGVTAVLTAGSGAAVSAVASGLEFMFILAETGLEYLNAKLPAEYAQDFVDGIDKCGGRPVANSASCSLVVGTCVAQVYEKYAKTLEEVVLNGGLNDELFDQVDSGYGVVDSCIKDDAVLIKIENNSKLLPLAAVSMVAVPALFVAEFLAPGGGKVKIATGRFAKLLQRMGKLPKGVRYAERYNNMKNVRHIFVEGGDNNVRGVLKNLHDKGYAVAVRRYADDGAVMFREVKPGADYRKLDNMTGTVLFTKDANDFKLIGNSKDWLSPLRGAGTGGASASGAGGASAKTSNTGGKGAKVLRTAKNVVLTGAGLAVPATILLRNCSGKDCSTTGNDGNSGSGSSDSSGGSNPSNDGNSDSGLKSIGGNELQDFDFDVDTIQELEPLADTNEYDSLW